MKITKKQYKKALEDNRILVAGTKRTSLGWTNFRVFMIKNNKIEEITVKTIYSNAYGGYKCTAVGTNRILEIILSIGNKLGLSFHEIKQRWQWLSEL